MDDLIKRSDAIKALESLPNADYWNSNVVYLDMATEAIENLPSADDWIPLNTELIASKYDVLGIHRGGFEPDTFMVVREGADDERDN